MIEQKIVEKEQRDIEPCFEEVCIVEYLLDAPKEQRLFNECEKRVITNICDKTMTFTNLTPRSHRMKRYAKSVVISGIAKNNIIIMKNYQEDVQ